ncbi:MAG: zinc-binding alcohol dehydrogenase family protein [Planctomycetota bacterium]
MKAIQLTEPGKFDRIELEAAGDPSPGQALVRTHRMGICGTDISGYLGKFPFYSYPRIPGHELGVEVLAVGDEVNSIQAGDRCSVEPYMNDPQSCASQRGRQNCCQELQVLGVHVDGGLRDEFLVRADKLHSSTQLSYDQLALVETLAIGCHAVGRGDPQPNEHALIVGLGPIGLATLEFVRLTGAKITVMDINTQRLEFCRQHYDIERTIHLQGDGQELAAMEAFTDGDLYRVVFDATGNVRAMNEALRFVAHTGTLVYVGLTTESMTIPDPLFHAREMTIKASRNALPDEFRRIIGLIEQGQIDTDRWITHQTHFDDMIGAFEAFTKPETGVLKAMVAVN